MIWRGVPGSGLLRQLCLSGLHYNGRTNWDTFSTAITAGEVLGRHFASDHGLEDQLICTLDDDPRDAGSIMALCEGWPASTALQSLRSRLTGKSQLPTPVAFKLMSVAAPPDRLVDALAWAADELQEDDTAYAQMRELLFGKPSPGMKASFPRLLARARGLTEDLHAWCQSETQRDKDLFVGEVGLDLIASHKRLVAQSLFDVLSERDV
jgi:hypothetical protein